MENDSIAGDGTAPAPESTARDPGRQGIGVEGGDQDGIPAPGPCVPSGPCPPISPTSQRGDDEGCQRGVSRDDRPAAALTADRYARHALIDWFDQDVIRRERLVVVGAGAVGNEVLKNLALLGVGELHVFDKDTIEIHNLPRSVLFRESDVGRSKAGTAAARLAELDPSVRVTPHAGDFWGTLKLRHLANADAAFCCVDNIEARIRLNRLCALVGTPLINVGIDSRFTVVEHFPFARGQRAPCYECGLPPSAYAEIAKRYSCGWLKRIAEIEKKIPTTILTSSGAAALAVSVYLRSVATGSPGQSCRYFQDSFNGATTQAVIEHRDGCPGCGDLLENRLLIPANRRIDSLLIDVLGSSGVGPLFCSDRVLIGVTCRQCAPDQQVTTIFDVADRYDETLAECPACRERSRAIVLRDQFTLDELARDYRGRRLPGKFITTNIGGDLQLIVELEGEDDGRRESDSENRGSDAQGRSDAAA